MRDPRTRSLGIQLCCFFIKGELHQPRKLLLVLQSLFSQKKITANLCLAQQLLRHPILQQPIRAVVLNLFWLAAPLLSIEGFGGTPT